MTPNSPLLDWVWLNGQFLMRHDAKVSALDRGLLEGLGLFETMAVRSAVPIRAGLHQDRLCRSLARIGLPPLPAGLDLPAVTSLLCERNMAKDCIARWTYTAGESRPTLLVHLRQQPRDLADRKRGSWGITLNVQRPFADLKTTSWISMSLASQQAVAQLRTVTSPVEAILTTRSGHILEGARTNIFVVRGEVLITPPADGRILPGVTRAYALELWARSGRRIQELPLRRGELRECDGAFLTSSILGAAPLIGLDTQTLASNFLVSSDAALSVLG